MWHLLLGCGEPGEIGLGEDRVADTVLARQIHVRKRQTDGGALRCEGAGVADELFEVALPPAEPRGESVRLDGLLADTTYRCEVVGLDQSSEVLEFTTDPLPDDLPRASVVEDGAPGGDYLVLNHGTDDKADRQTKILVYDARGRLRFYHWVPFEAPDLDVQYLGGGHFLYGGGYRALPTVIDLSGQILRQAPGPFERGNYNHTVEQLPDGTVLTTETSPNRDPNDATNTWMGFSIELLDPSLQGRVFTLNSQTFVDRGELPVATTSSDPYHLNALQWLASEGQVIANLYRMSEVLWFDVSERTLVERFGARTSWRLVDDAGEDLPASEWFYGEHAIELDGDLMLMHDNGAGRPSPERYSRAVEYQLDFDTRTATITWDWTQPGWFENIWGDVDRLPDGRVSITHAHCEKCTDVAGQRTEVMVVSRDAADGEVDWRLRFEDPHDASYRSAWIDGCDLFHRVSVCD